MLSYGYARKLRKADLKKDPDQTRCEHDHRNLMDLVLIPAIISPRFYLQPNCVPNSINAAVSLQTGLEIIEDPVAFARF